MDKQKKLEPCPFCGDDRPVLLYSTVRCRSCGAVGPFHSVDDQAIKMWNTRPLPLSQQSGGRDEKKRFVPG